MRTTTLPICEFLRGAVNAAADDRTYAGVAVVLDRSAERSGLIEEVIKDASSLDAITGEDIALLIPGVPETRDTTQWLWLKHPYNDWDYAGGRGVLTFGAQHLAREFWARNSESIEDWARKQDLFDPKVQDTLAASITRAASDTCQCLQLEEDDIPSLVLLCTRERHMFVIRLPKSTSAYSFFKEVRKLRPQHRGVPTAWLVDAVRATVQDQLRFVEGMDLHAAPFVGWTAERFRAAGVKPLGSINRPL